MSSQGETETRMILGSTLSNTRLLVIAAVFGVAILIAVSIWGKKRFHHWVKLLDVCFVYC